MKARKVEGLDPSGRCAPTRRGSSRTRLDELRGFAAEALEPGAGDAPSTTCGSPPSGCATCSRSSAPASAPRPRRRAVRQGAAGGARRAPRLRRDAAQGRRHRLARGAAAHPPRAALRTLRRALAGGGDPATRSARPGPSAAERLALEATSACAAREPSIWRLQVGLASVSRDRSPDVHRVHCPSHLFPANGEFWR